jgi:predicted HD phosphohydrolase
MRYQTDVHVSADRYVCLQLPTYFPEGRAVVTVTIETEASPSASQASSEEVDREDIEWWDEFDEESGRLR